MPAAAGTDHAVTGELDARLAAGAAEPPRSTATAGGTPGADGTVTDADPDATGPSR